MRRPALLLAALLAVSACAQTEPATEVLPGEESSGATAKRIVNAVGTPFHALIKGTACVVSGAAAVPAASALSIRNDTYDKALKRDIYTGVGRTCGGSYVLGRD